MVKNGFAPIELDEYVTNHGVDHVEVIKQLESTIGLALALSMLKADLDYWIGATGALMFQVHRRERGSGPRALNPFCR